MPRRLTGALGSVAVCSGWSVIRVPFEVSQQAVPPVVRAVPAANRVRRCPAHRPFGPSTESTRSSDRRNIRAFSHVKEVRLKHRRPMSLVGRQRIVGRFVRFARAPVRMWSGPQMSCGIAGTMLMLVPSKYPSDPERDLMTVDSFDACANELMSFIRTHEADLHLAGGEGRAGAGATRAHAARRHRRARTGPALGARRDALPRPLHGQPPTGRVGVVRLGGAGAGRRRPAGVPGTGRPTKGDACCCANMDARRAMLRDLMTDWSEDERLDFARLLGQLNKSLVRRQERALPPVGAGVGEPS